MLKVNADKNIVENKAWLAPYCQALVTQIKPGETPEWTTGLRLKYSQVATNANGDLLAKPETGNGPSKLNQPQLALPELVEANRFSILLGRAGSGKSQQLKSLTLQHAQTGLVQPSQGRSKPVLPVYLDLADASLADVLSKQAGGKANLFGVLLESEVNRRLNGETLPADWQNQVNLEILIDEMELLDPALTPLFFYHLNAWLEESQASQLRIVVSCRTASYSLYQRWFKTEQGWQIYSLDGFAWSEVKTVLDERLAKPVSGPTLAHELESNDLTGLLTHPALATKLFPYIEGAAHQAGELISGLNTVYQGINHFLKEGQQSLTPVLLEQSSQLPSTLTGQAQLRLPTMHEQPEIGYPGQTKSPQAHFTRQQTATSPEKAADPLEQALGLGLLEKQAVSGKLVWGDSRAEKFTTVWFCLELEPRQLPAALDSLFEASKSGPTGEAQLLDFLVLFYRLLGPDRRTAFLNSWLGQPPQPDRLEWLSRLEEKESDFGQAWQAYLNEIIDSPFGQQLLALCGQFNIETLSPARARLVEIALRQQIEAGGPVEAANYLKLGHLYQRLGQADKALENYQKAEKSAPERLPAQERMAMANLLRQGGQHQPAAQQLEQARSSLRQDQARLEDQFCQIKIEEGDWAGAVQDARRAVGLAPLPLYRYHLGLALFESGEPLEAAQVLKELCQASPDYAEAIYTLGRLQLQQGHFDEAQASFQQAVKLQPATALYLFDLGRSLAAADQYQQAAVYLQTAFNQTAQTGFQPSYALTLGLVKLKLEGAAGARPLFQRVLDESGFRPNQAHLYLAACDYLEGHSRAALTRLRAALEKAPQRVFIQLLCAVLAEGVGLLAEARTHYEQATFEATDSPWLWQVRQLGLARYWRLNADFAKAQAILAEVAALEPNPNIAMLSETGQLELAKQDWKAAVLTFKTGLERLTENQSGAADPLAAILSQLVAATEATGGQDNKLAEPSTAQQTAWLELFTTPHKLAFELSYFYALSLEHTGQPAQAQSLWQTQLGLLEISQNVEAGSLDFIQRNRWRAQLQHQLGLSLLNATNAAAAIDWLQRAVKTEPANPLYHLTLGQAGRRAGQYEMALAELKQARELDANLTEVYAELARTQLEARGDRYNSQVLLTALNLYLKALELQPGNTLYQYQAALLAYHLNHHNQTTILLQKLLQFAPRLPAAWLLAACNLERTGELTSARQHLKRSLQLSSEVEPTSLTPSPVVYRLTAARLARQAGAVTELAETLGQLSGEKLAPDWQAALEFEQGWLAQAQGELEKASPFYSQGLATFATYEPANQPRTLEEHLYHGEKLWDERGLSLKQVLETTYRLGYARLLMRLAGQREAAIDQVDRAIKLRPDFAAALFLRTELLMAQGLQWAALGSLKSATEIDPQPARLFELAELYFQLGELEESIQTFKLLAGQPEITAQSEYYASFGRAYQQAGQYRSARWAYSRALQIQPVNPAVQLALAECYVNDSEWQSAVQPLQEAVTQAPQEPLYHFRLAELYQKLGWWQEAYQEYEETTRLEPSNSVHWLRKGQMLAAQHQLLPAQTAIAEAVRLDDTAHEAHFELGRLYLQLHRQQSSRN